MSASFFHRMVVATGLLLAATASASTADYRDPKNVFGFSYDDSIWSLDIDANGDFGLQCKPESCKSAVTGCYVNKQRVLFGSVERIMQSFNTERIAQEQIAAFVEEKVAVEKDLDGKIGWDKAADVPPQVVQAYAPREIAGHPFLQAEFRMSMAGQAARYVSYMTASGSHSIAIVCHATESAIDDWRPRFEALMGSFQPAPRTKTAR